MTDQLILYELQKIHETLTKTKEEHTLNFRVIKPTEKFNFSEPILNSSKLGLIRLSVYNSVFNVNRRNSQFLYDTQGETWTDTRILANIPGAYELIEIAETKKEETNGNVIIEPDKNNNKTDIQIEPDNNGNKTDILCTFTLTEPPGYLINIIPTNILHPNVINDRIEYIEFHIKDEHGRPIDFNGDVLSFTLHLV